ncbi:RhoGEF domain containing protein [Balamuthia mandrillaris]
MASENERKERRKGIAFLAKAIVAEGGGNAGSSEGGGGTGEEGSSKNEETTQDQDLTSQAVQQQLRDRIRQEGRVSGREGDREQQTPLQPQPPQNQARTSGVLRTSPRSSPSPSFDKTPIVPFEIPVPSVPKLSFTSPSSSAPNSAAPSKSSTPSSSCVSSPSGSFSFPSAGNGHYPPTSSEEACADSVWTRAEQPVLTEEKMLRLREQAISELITTETDYVRDIKLIYSLYYHPLKQLGILDKQQFIGIFSNLQIIINVNTELEATLSNCDPKDPNQCIGPIFIKAADYLKMYTQYCANQSKCVTILDELEQSNKAFASFLDDCATSAGSRGLSINSFLIKPVQRICKYPLFLKELLKYTPDSHPDYKDLQAAYEKVSSVVEVVNQKKRESEDMQKILEIQGTIQGLHEGLKLLEPARRLVMEGWMHKVAHHGRAQYRLFYLFTDLLIYVKPLMMSHSKNKQGAPAKPKLNRSLSRSNLKGVVQKGREITKQVTSGRKQYQFKGYVDLRKAILRDVDSNEFQHAFEIIRLEGKKTPVLIVCADQEEKDRWYNAINENISTYLKHAKEKDMHSMGRSPTYSILPPLQLPREGHSLSLLSPRSPPALSPTSYERSVSLPSIHSLSNPQEKEKRAEKDEEAEEAGAESRPSFLHSPRSIPIISPRSSILDKNGGGSTPHSSSASSSAAASFASSPTSSSSASLLSSPNASATKLPPPIPSAASKPITLLSREQNAGTSSPSVPLRSTSPRQSAQGNAAGLLHQRQPVVKDQLFSNMLASKLNGTSPTTTAPATAAATANRGPPEEQRRTSANKTSSPVKTAAFPWMSPSSRTNAAT